MGMQPRYVETVEIEEDGTEVVQVYYGMHARNKYKQLNEDEDALHKEAE